MDSGHLVVLPVLTAALSDRVQRSGLAFDLKRHLPECKSFRLLQETRGLCAQVRVAPACAPARAPHGTGTPQRTGRLFVVKLMW